MSSKCLTQELQGKPIISMTNGAIIAKVVDILVDPGALRVAAAVTSKGSLLQRGRETEIIPAEEVQVWGQDAVLAVRPDVIVKDSELPGSGTWLSVASQLKGRDVITGDGTRVGQLNDVVIDVDGAFVAYDLARPFAYGDDPAQTMKHIPAEATRVLGQDVLIVEMNQSQAPPLIEEPQREEPSPVEGPFAEEELPAAEDMAESEENQLRTFDLTGGF